jgi:HTH-type transcriptional regulator / antitoxin HigA
MLSMIKLTQSKLYMLKPVKTKKDYEAALQHIYVLMQKDLKPGSKSADELEVLSILVEAYEKKHYPVPPPHPLEAIKFRLEQLGLSETELTSLLGGRSRKSEILSGRRKLSLVMIRELHDKLKIPAETLIAAY